MVNVDVSKRRFNVMLLKSYRDYIPIYLVVNIFLTFINKIVKTKMTKNEIFLRNINRFKIAANHVKFLVFR